MNPRAEDRFVRFGNKLGKTLAVLAALALVLLAIGYHTTLQSAEGRLFERARDVPPRQVTIVLGALVFRNGRLSDVVADRVNCAIELFRAGRVDTVLVSGDHGHGSYDEVSTMGAALLRAGIPENRIFLDHAGFRTLDTMHRASAVFEARDAVICTQRFHLPRALFLAEHFGVDAVGLIADKRRYRSELFNELREALARAAAVLDVAIGRSAAVLGPRIPLTGDARVTHDRPLATAQP